MGSMALDVPGVEGAFVLRCDILGHNVHAKRTLAP